MKAFLLSVLVSAAGILTSAAADNRTNNITMPTPASNSSVKIAEGTGIRMMPEKFNARQNSLPTQRAPHIFDGEDGVAYMNGYLIYDRKFKTLGTVSMNSKSPSDYEMAYEFGTQVEQSLVFSAATYVGDDMYGLAMLYLGNNTYYPQSIGILDPETGEYTKKADVAPEMMFNEMTYEPKTGLIYAMIYDDGVASGTGNYQTTIYTINPQTMEMKTVAVVPDVMYTMSADNGSLYGVAKRRNGSGSYLLKIDIQTINEAEKTCRIDTLNYDAGLGVEVGDYWQSMEFDKTTHRLWWVAQTADEKSSLIELDPATGSVISRTSIDRDPQIVGLSIPYQFVADKAPSYVCNLTVEPAAMGALAVTLTWTNPQKDYRNNTLESLSGVKVYRDGELIETLTATGTGQEQTWQDNNVTSGEHVYKVMTYNAEGDGVYKEVKVFAGRDVPGAPELVTLRVSGSSGALTWYPPTEGAHGGWFDKSTLKYDVVRLPDNVELATNISDRILTVTADVYGNYSYRVTAHNAEGMGGSKESNVVGFGPYSELPLTSSLATAEDFATWAVLDNNKDGDTWHFNSYSNVGEYTRAEGPADDYLISQPLLFTAGKQYQVRYTYYTTNWLEPGTMEPIMEKMKICFGTSPTAEGLSTTIKDIGEFHTASEIYLHGKDLFTPATTGAAYVAFHAYSDADRGSIYLKDISIREYSERDLSITGYRGNITVNSTVKQTYYVDVTNEGSAAVSDYTVELFDSETNTVLGTAQGRQINPDETLQITVDWVPGAEGQIKVAARVVLSGDTYPADNEAAPIDVTIAAADADKWITVNTDNQEGWNFPFYFQSKYAQGQCVYREEELQMKDIKITGMEFTYSCYAANEFTRPVRIFMKKTDRSNLMSEEDQYIGIFEESDWTKVFDGNITIQNNTDQSKLHIIFDTPFEYTGGNVNIKFEVPMNDNLLIDGHPTWRFNSEYGSGRAALFRSNWADVPVADEIFTYDYVPYLRISYENGGGAGIMTLGQDEFGVTVAGKRILLSATCDNVQIISLSGSVVYTGRKVSEVNASSLPAGIYLVRATIGGEVKVVKTTIK